MCAAVRVSAALTGKDGTSITVSEQDETERFEVNVKNGYIYVSTSRPATIQIYSILGQLVMQQSVPSGTTRLKAPTRGIYILKAGARTMRITIN